MSKTKAAHPAPYSRSVIAKMREILLERWPEDAFWGRPMIFDPFAGEGLRLAEIAGAEFDYGGVELEASLIKSDRIKHGNALEPDWYPRKPFVIATSPVYANGVADHHEARDESQRYTYRTAVAAIEGKDRELHPDNMGRYGYRGTKRPEDGGRSTKREQYWRVARGAAEHWKRAELVIVNVSDFISHHDVIEPHVADWTRLLLETGWSIDEVHYVETPRNGNGANRETRADAECILVAVRSES